MFRLRRDRQLAIGSFLFWHCDLSAEFENTRAASAQRARLGGLNLYSEEEEREI
jgi:hypothetical protein